MSKLSRFILVYTNILLALGCSGEVTQPPETANIEDFITSVEGNWRSPCLFEPDRQQGPNTGDYVIYEMEISSDEISIRHQDYLDVDCLNAWPHGSGGYGTGDPFFRLDTTEGGLTVLVFRSQTVVDIVEIDEDSETFSGSSDATITPILDIMYLSDTDELFFGDLSSGDGEFSPPTRLNFIDTWTRI